MVDDFSLDRDCVFCVLCTLFPNNIRCFLQFQERLGPLPSAGFNTAVSAAVAAVAASRDLNTVTTSSSAFFPTSFHNSQTPPTTPLSVSTISSHDPLFSQLTTTISDHFNVNGSTSTGSFTVNVNGINSNANTLAHIQNSRKMNENCLVVSTLKNIYI